MNGTMTSYTYSAANVLTNRGYAFDANGIQTAGATYTYAAGVLTKVTDPVGNQTK